MPADIQKITTVQETDALLAPMNIKGASVPECSGDTKNKTRCEVYTIVCLVCVFVFLILMDTLGAFTNTQEEKPISAIQMQSGIPALVPLCEPIQVQEDCNQKKQTPQAQTPLS
jgi:hypothetical protein